MDWHGSVAQGLGTPGLYHIPDCVTSLIRSSLYRLKTWGLEKISQCLHTHKKSEYICNYKIATFHTFYCLYFILSAQLRVTPPLTLSPIHLLAFPAICVEFYHLAVLECNDLVAGFYGFPTKWSTLLFQQSFSTKYWQYACNFFFLIHLQAFYLRLDFEDYVTHIQWIPSSAQHCWPPFHSTSGPLETESYTHNSVGCGSIKSKAFHFPWCFAVLLCVPFSVLTISNFKTLFPLLSPPSHHLPSCAERKIRTWGMKSFHFLPSISASSCPLLITSLSLSDVLLLSIFPPELLSQPFPLLRDLTLTRERRRKINKTQKVDKRRERKGELGRGGNRRENFPETTSPDFQPLSLPTQTTHKSVQSSCFFLYSPTTVSPTQCNQDSASITPINTN